MLIQFLLLKVGNPSLVTGVVGLFCVLLVKSEDLDFDITMSYGIAYIYASVFRNF